MQRLVQTCTRLDGEPVFFGRGTAVLHVGGDYVGVHLNNNSDVVDLFAVGVQRQPLLSVAAMHLTAVVHEQYRGLELCKFRLARALDADDRDPMVRKVESPLVGRCRVDAITTTARQLDTKTAPTPAWLAAEYERGLPDLRVYWGTSRFDAWTDLSSSRTHVETRQWQLLFEPQHLVETPSLRQTRPQPGHQPEPQPRPLSHSIPVVMFVSFTPAAASDTTRIGDSLWHELQEIQDLQFVEPVTVQVRGRTRNLCRRVPANADDLVEDLINMALSEAHHIEGLVMLFCGHGEDEGLVCTNGETISNAMLSEYVGLCAPACVIFNTCHGSALAALTSKTAPSTGIVYWAGRVDTHACSALSKQLLRTFSVVSGNRLALPRAAKTARDMISARHDVDALRFWPAGQSEPIAWGIGNPTVTDVQVPWCTYVDQEAVRGRNVYKGSLRTPGVDWQRDCWQTLFNQPAVFAGMHLLRGEYRCIFSFYFDCIPGPSRAYYFETWPLDADEISHALLHVHYWDKPDIEQPGLPKHVNLRRAWPVDLPQLRLRAEGHVLGPLPPPTGMAKCDVKPWHTAMTQFLHRYYRADVDPAAERVRACTALESFSHINFCPRTLLWAEKGGACVTGGPTGKVVDRKRMDRPGWDFMAAGPYPFQPASEYPLGFAKPGVPPEAVAAVLIHAEDVRMTMVAHAEPEDAAKPAWRGQDAMLRRCQAQACALANGLGAFADDDDGVGIVP
eukprot:m.410650 g.410650  ORF g.410650 m.410650 type:complete len:732 (-) comp28469_c0_seq2:687-2882(-)